MGDWQHYDRLTDARAELLSEFGEAPSMREMVTASLLADEGRASHHGTYARRLPPARLGPSTDAAAANDPRVTAGVPPGNTGALAQTAGAPGTPDRTPPR